MNSPVDESFPYPLTITRDAFADNAGFDPDYFLFKNHRFTSLETLLSDLSDLSKALNRELLDLVNNEYANFIQLGQSISCGLELIESVSYDLDKFNKSVEQTVESLTASSSVASSVLGHKKRLNLLKNKIKLILLLNEQCTSFETLLGFDVDQQAPDELVDKVNTLATLYFSVVKIYSVLMEANRVCEPRANGSAGAAYASFNDLPSIHSVAGSVETKDEICAYFDKNVKTKVVSLKFEFTLYMKELQQFAKQDCKKYSQLLLLILQISRITGQTLDLFEKDS